METKIEKKDNLSIISLDGSINSQNAPEFEKAVIAEPGESDGIIIDVTKLEYISSAGLRIILSLKKRCKGKSFKIIGANQSVMDIFEVTGFSDIMDIEAAKRHVNIQGCTKIGAGACGECYRLDDETIIKLYYSKVSEDEIENEKKLAKKAFVMGVPTAISYDIVESEGRTGVVYELLNCKTLAELIREEPENLEKYVDMYVNVCKQIHEIDGEGQDLPSFKDANREDIKKVTGITDEERGYLYHFLDIVPDSNYCIHGDLNLNNIMVQNGECCLIDMGEFSTGLNLFDLSRILFSFKYVPNPEDTIHDFYKLPMDTIHTIHKIFFTKYFGSDDMEEVIKKDPTVEWLEPLAWFRCVASMLKGERWPENKREQALGLLRNKLIPFIHEKDKN